MPDQIQSTRIVCEGGLNTSQNFLTLSELSPGSATRLINFEPSITGGYRRIEGFTKINSTYYEVTSVANPAEGPVLGIWGFHNKTTGTFQIMAARKLVGSAVYGIYLFDSGTGWSKINTGTTQSSTNVDHVRAVIFNTQTANYIIFVDGVNKALAFNSTTWYQLDSANAGGAGSPGGNQVLNAPAVVAYFKGHVFFGHDATNPAIVAFSAPNDPLTWTVAAGGGQLLPGFDIVQIKPFRDENFIFGSMSIRKAIPDESSGFVLQDVTNDIGCIAQDSVIEVGGSLLFLSPDGIRPIAGTTRIADIEFGLISENIHDTVLSFIDRYTIEHMHAVVIRAKTQFRYFFSDSTTTTADAVGLLGSIQGPEGSNGEWEFTEINGIQANAVWSGYDQNDDEVVLHGDNSGYVYYQENGNSFNGSNITAVYQTPYLDLGDTTIRKLLRRLDLFVKAEGNVNLSIEVSYDWGRSTAINPSAYSVSSTAGAAIYDGGFLYDGGNLYADASQPVFPVNIQGSGYSVRFGFASNDTNAPYTIQGLVLSFSVKGRE